VPGPMQFGAVNNAGQERTQLISTGLVPDPATAATLLITNPGVGRGIQIGEFPEIGNPTLGLLSSAFARGVWARADNVSPSAIGVVASGRTGVTVQAQVPEGRPMRVSAVRLTESTAMA
jgi:hypothetical protein